MFARRTLQGESEKCLPKRKSQHPRCERKAVYLTRQHAVSAVALCIAVRIYLQWHLCSGEYPSTYSDKSVCGYRLLREPLQNNRVQIHYKDPEIISQVFRISGTGGGGGVGEGQAPLRFSRCILQISVGSFGSCTPWHCKSEDVRGIAGSF